MTTAPDPDAFARRYLPDAVTIARHLLRGCDAAQRDFDIIEGLALDGLFDACRTWKPGAGANPFTWLHHKVRGRVSQWRRGQMAASRGGTGRTGGYAPRRTLALDNLAHDRIDCLTVWNDFSPAQWQTAEAAANLHAAGQTAQAMILLQRLRHSA